MTATKKPEKADYYVLDDGMVVGPMTYEEARHYADYGSPNYGRNQTRTLMSRGAMSDRMIREAIPRKEARRT